MKQILGARPWAPTRLVDLIGIDYFGHVTAVDFFFSSTVSVAAIEQ